MLAHTLDHTDNNAWYRQMAAGWARRMIKGDVPAAWAENTDSEIQFAIAQLGLRPGDRILDLGCGWGRHSIPLAAYGLQVTGLDLSHDLLTLAQYNARRYKLNVEWIEGDIATMPLAGPFAAIAQFCGNLMTWFADPNQTMDVLWKLASLLKPGGRFLCGTADWQADLPLRSQDWDEWDSGAAIYRQRFDHQRRMLHTQTVVFGPRHERSEFRRQIWWPSQQDMERLFMRVGLLIRARYSTFDGAPFDPQGTGLVYVLEREDG